ncbi:MAG TPA: FAD-dependent monooxygenase [Vicinamibacterales bacterium]|nr:FAD-dependent monooxygenase [Vicinamibacterales bacterium]
MHVVPPPGRLLGTHALVIGASISGLLAARILAAHFQRVTLFDRDVLPSAVENRKAVPQGRHGHGLLASGYRGLKRLFPDLERELLQRGAVPGDIIGDVRWFQHGCYKAKFRSGFDGLLLSRALLETTLRAQVLQIPNVRIDDESHVLGLTEESGVVGGVQVSRGQKPAVRVAADLVVDAGGRASRSADWLEELGYGRPAVEEVPVDIRYTSMTFRRRPRDLGGDNGAILAPKPPRERAVGFMLAMEGNRWIVSMGGWLGTRAPLDLEGFVAFARELPRPDIYEVIRDAEPLTEAVGYVFPSNLRRRYERMRRFPGRYLVMGDAMCSFNPLYGQGMSVATLEALALAEALSRASTPAAVSKPFFKAASRIIDTPWTIAAGSDMAFEGVTGRRPAGTDVVNWYLNHVHRAAATDRVVCRAFFDVANLLEPAPTLFRPSIVARVVRACVGHDSPLTIEADRSMTTAPQAMIETR